MKIKQSILISAVLVLGLNYSATAEMRIWTDQNGKTIEAEHIRTMDDKVILKMADEVEIKVSLDTLTEKDRKYAILMAPPRVEINVATQTDRDNKAVGPDSRGPGFQVQKEKLNKS